ncbi:hypothetical protein GCM10025734_32970 [Kitasatospora paranensis]
MCRGAIAAAEATPEAAPGAAVEPGTVGPGAAGPVRVRAVRAVRAEGGRGAVADMLRAWRAASM